MCSLFQADDQGWGLPIFQDGEAAWGEDETTWGKDEKEAEIKRYFRAEYFTEEETNQKSEFLLLCVICNLWTQRQTSNF